MSFKHFLRRRWLRLALCVVLARYIRLVHATSRWRTIGGEMPERLWGEGKPAIVAFWHGRLMMMPLAWRRGVPFSMLSSQHPDGLYSTGTIRHFGMGAVFGSSSRGGGAAMRSILKALKAGISVGFTPDGPRGPRMRVSAGVIHAARLGGVPILPCTFATRRRRVLGSWDRFVLALPFTRGVFIWDDPITVPRDATESEIETARRRLEDRLNAITAEADRMLGVETTAPADAPASDSADTADSHEEDVRQARVSGS